MPALVALVALLGVFLMPSPSLAYETRHIFITNRGGGNVVELDEGFVYQRTWFHGMAYEGLQLASPNGMAFTPDGSLFMADTNNLRILAFDGEGNFVRAFSTETRLGSAVESIYFDGTGVLFASANPGLGVVARFTQTGGDLDDVVNDPAFTSLGNVNLTNVGTVIVSDFSGTGRGLREISPDTGEVVRTFGTDLGRQEDVMIDGAGRVFVSHFDGDEIVVFGPAPDRAELFRFRAPEGTPLSLEWPSGIALTHDCIIVVASFTNAGIFLFRHQGDAPPTFERLLRPGVEIPAGVMFSATESIAVSGLGLPGSFDEFADQVPSCDEVVSTDAGVRTDAGVPADSGAPTDSGSVPPLDAGRGGGTTDEGGCGCTAIGADEQAPLPLTALFVIATALVYRRRRC